MQFGLHSPSYGWFLGIPRELMLTDGDVVVEDGAVVVVSVNHLHLE